MKVHPVNALKPYSQYFTRAADIYRQALPHSNNDVIDITRVTENGVDFALEFLNSLLTDTTFTKPLATDFHLNRQLGSLYFESRNQQKNKGRQVTGFGFPMYIGQDEEQLVSIPLFIWSMQIDAGSKPNIWTIHRQAGNTIRLNPFFSHFMMMKYEKNIEDLIRSQFGNKINAANLAIFCNQLAEELELEINSQQVSIMPCPSTEMLDQFHDCAGIQWSGIIGNFPFVPAKRDTENISNILSEAPVVINYHNYGIGKLDPWQATALAKINDSFITLVEGGSGTGKTHLLKHLATKALANNGKCLIVSKHIPVLRAIQQELAQTNAEELTFLLRDETTDRVLLSELLKAKSKLKIQPAEEPDTAFRVLSDRLFRKQQLMEARYQASRQKVFGDKTWAETVSLFLESNQLEPKELLSSYLDEQDFKYEEAELEAIVKGIAQAPALFAVVGTLDHPLSILNSGIFLHYEEKQGFDFIKSHLEKFSKGATELQYKFIHLQNEYAEQLKSHYDLNFHELRNLGMNLKDKLEDYTSHFGNELRKSGKGTLKLYGIFSDKFRQALNRREEIFTIYNQLREAHESSQLFEHQFEPGDKNIDKLSENLDTYNEQLQTWWKNQKSSTRDELTRLSYKTALPELNLTEKLKGLEDEMEAFFEELNNSGLFQLPLNSNMLTLPRKQKFLEDKMSVMEQTAYHLRDYKVFYPWQRFWFSQNTITRKVIKALARINPLNWEAAFKSWYFNRALSLNYDPDLPSSDFEMEAFHEGLNTLHPQIDGTIKSNWTKKRIQQQENLKSLTDSIDSNKTSIRQIFESGAAVVTDFLPILLATPQMATKLMSSEKTFDYLLIDEAHSSFPEANIDLFPLAKRVVVFSNPLEEVSGDAALPEILRNSETATFQLGQVHADRAVNEIQEARKGSLMIERINGRFEEDSNTNTEEIDKIIHLLNTIEKTGARTFPSVGIVCFTKQQRDLLQEYMLRIKQQRHTGVETIQQLERNGLGVFHVNELNGHLFDTVILSTTYGETGVKNNISRKINRLNSPENIAGFYKLLNSTKDKLHVIHSIPEPVIEEFLSKETDKGTYLLAKLLYPYNTNNDSSPEVEKFSTWTEQLERIMRQKFPNASFKQEGNFLTMKDEETSTQYLLLTDGCFAQTPNTDFYWEFEKRKEWEEKGYEIMPVWSVELWKG